jgi:hypothetical protein
MSMGTFLSRGLVIRDYSRHLQKRFAPVLQGVFYLVEELVGDGAIDHAVVVA